ncbi:hypothetical protein [Granulicatella elegans]|uniref:hypothetical protein n=1 Tax=Granulicatella elegans TaxID=137732 RepID=UPI00061D7941|nr:hypothetical protein [Granulicatella elegans]UEA30840.1 hypothetical protein LK443_06045 [Granulicatella elegans]
MTEHNLSPQNDDLKEFGDSFAKFSRKNTSWLYLLFIIVVLFGVVYLFNTVSKRTKTPIESYREEFIQLKGQIQQQELKIEQLEQQIKQLSEKP